MTTQNQTFEHDTSKQIENNNYTSDEEDSDIEPEKQGYVLLSDSMNENTNVVSDNQVNNHEELHQYPHLDDNFDDNEIKIKNKKGNKDESLAKSAIEKFDRNYITEVENAIKECKTPQKSEPIPSEDIDLIKSTMKSISLNYTPQWAQDVPEQVWLKHLLDKIENK